MNVLYIVGRGSKHDNIELRWSLRSLALYGEGVERVIVAGNPPAWLSDDVEKIEIEDHPLPQKNRRLTHAMLEAIERANLCGDFLFCADDTFLSSPTQLDTVPLFVKDYDLPEGAKPGEKITAFLQCLCETRRFCRERGLPSVNFQQHALVRLSADVIRKNAALIRESIDETPRGCEILSLCNNLVLRESPWTPLVWRKDVKFGASDYSLDAVRDPFVCGQFSISDATFGCAAFVADMEANFSAPCRFELGGPTKDRGIIAALRRAFT